MNTHQTKHTDERTPNDLLTALPDAYRTAFTKLMKNVACELDSVSEHSEPAHFPVAVPYPIIPAEQGDPFLRKAWVIFAMLVHAESLPIPDAGKRDTSESLALTIAIIRSALYYCNYGKTE